MLSFRNQQPRCNRREFLRVGALGVAGLSLADVLRADARPGASRPKSVIYIVLDGGPSHIDMWDLKPDAPAEFRGPFKPIATRLPGVQICEHMPRQAAMMNDFALLRGVRSVENDHYLAEVYTGLPRSAGKRPAFGSVAARFAPGASPVPSYVSLDRPTTDEFEYEKPFYLGSGYAPFRPFGDAVDDLRPAKSLDTLNDRRDLLRTFDGVRRVLDRSGAFDGLDKFQTRALEIMTSPQVRDAFDMSREPRRTLDAYGKGKYPHQTVKDIMYDWDAKKFILARRLVEAGARVVTLRAGSWDHHSGPTSDIFHALKHLLPLVDASVTALVSDLKARGLDKEVLVVVLGEFGRTPKITPQGPGREHWADAGCVLLSGGGVKAGQVIGATDSRAERAKEGSIGFQNVIATIYHVLGVDTSAMPLDFNGRPQHVLYDREPVRELVA